MRKPYSWCVAVLFLLLGNASGFGQDANAPSIQREAMKKLSFLEGQWKGGELDGIRTRPTVRLGRNRGG